MMLCDRLYGERPDLIQHVYVTDAEQLRENQTFKHIALGMDVVQAGKLTIEPRFPFFAFAAEYVDCVVSQQRENGLNYLYY